MRFYFNIDDQRDGDGVELASIAEAKCEAIKLAGQVVCEGADTFWDRSQWGMTVTDENGLTLFHIEIVGTEAPAIRGRSQHSASASQRIR